MIAKIASQSLARVGATTLPHRHAKSTLLAPAQGFVARAHADSPAQALTAAMRPIAQTKGTAPVHAANGSSCFPLPRSAGSGGLFLRNDNHMTRFQSYSRRLLCLLPLLLAAALTGCGGGDSDGNAGGAPAPDNQAPTVSATTPADAATGVPTNRAISAVFDEALAASSISAASFTLTGPGKTPVAGAVSVMGTTAIFTPSSPLAASTAYQATLSTGVRDSAGNTLAAQRLWGFTTADAAQAQAKGPAPVVLGTAGTFAILAKAGVSTTGTTKVLGDIGVSPAAETFITGFSQTRDASNTFSTSSLVTGKLFASNMAPPTPSNMTTAISNMEAAYTDAAGRPLPSATELGAGNISGLTLAPGLYKWGTGLEINASGVTLSGGANDVWILQIAKDLTVGSGAIVTLAGGAQAKNVFWQVAGLTTLGTTSDVKGTILSKTLIALRTGATLNGRALAQTAVTLDANAVTTP
jgi:hypothetical protein